MKKNDLAYVLETLIKVRDKLQCTGKSAVELFMVETCIKKLEEEIS